MTIRDHSASNVTTPLVSIDKGGPAGLPLRFEDEGPAFAVGVRVRWASGGLDGTILQEVCRDGSLIGFRIRWDDGHRGYWGKSWWHMLEVLGPP